MGEGWNWLELLEKPLTLICHWPLVIWRHQIQQTTTLTANAIHNIPRCDSDLSFWNIRSLYEEESVKMSQMYTKRKTCDAGTWKKNHLFLDVSSTNIHTLVPSLYQCVETLVSAISAPAFQPRRWRTLPTANRKHFIMNILCIVSFCSQNTYNRALLLGSKRSKHGRHTDYWNQPLNMRMSVWYLDYHEAGLCCYLLIHIGNLLRPLQLFYFHLWPAYWLPLLLHAWYKVLSTLDHWDAPYRIAQLKTWRFT
jgi:hypothetical protein